MKTVRIKVWDRTTGGKKYTRHFYVTVNKGLAPSVKKCLKKFTKQRNVFLFTTLVATTGVETVQHQNIALDLPLTSTQMKTI